MVPASPSTNDLESEVTGGRDFIKLRPAWEKKKREEKKGKREEGGGGRGKKKKRIRKHSLFIRGLKVGGG